MQAATRPRRVVGCLWIIGVLAGPASAQERTIWFRAGFGSGAALEGLGIGPTLGVSGVRTATLDVGWRLSGDSGWKEHYNGPSLGVGLLMLDVQGTFDFGSPGGAYAFFRWPIVDGARADLELELAAGLAAGWEPFDAITNPDQRAIGSSVTALLLGTPSIALHLTDRWSVSAGLTISHYSNGSLTQPNRGLTAVSPRIGLEWVPAGVWATRGRGGTGGATAMPGPEAALDGDADGDGVADGNGDDVGLGMGPRSNDATGGARRPTEASAASEAPWAWRARLYGGVKAVRVEGLERQFTDRAAVQGATASVRRRLANRLRAVGSIDLLHDPTGLRRNTIDDAAHEQPLALGERLSLGMSLGLEWAIGRVRVETAWGRAVWRRTLDAQVRRRFEKYGVSVGVTEGLEIGLMVRTNQHISQFVEVGAAWVR